MKTKPSIDYIAGSSGFIGTHLSEYLINNNNVSIGKIDRALKLIPPLEEGTQIRDIYYLSSYGNLHGQINRGQIFTVNVENAQSLLDDFLMGGYDFRLFFYFSSSSVYKRQLHALKETDPLEGTTDYEHAKIIGENACKLYADDNRIVVIRPFSVTGVGEQDIHLIPTLIKAAYTGKLVTLDPNPVHDFVDVQDVISGLDVIRNEEMRKPYGISYWNIGTGLQYTNLEVLSLVEKVSGRKIDVEYKSRLRPYDTNQYWVANITKLNNLGWEPKYKLEDTIDRMCADYVRCKTN